MKRLYLFEFHELDWLPTVLRNGVTDYLQESANRHELYKPVIPVIMKGVEQSQTHEIVDMCSGGGGGLLHISRELKSHGMDCRITMSDKFPNIPAFKKISERSGGNIGFIESPVDATNTAPTLRGFRTLFLSFHHFRPTEAKKILQNAVDCNVPIGIFEGTDRNISDLLCQCRMVPYYVLRFTRHIKPFQLDKWIFTYLIPLIPLIMIWDTFVSVMRTYSVEELEQMTKEIDAPNYNWEIKKISNFFLYLFGYPKNNSSYLI